MTTTNAKTDITVLHWGSHPDKQNDDCHVGADFDNLDEALAWYHAVAGRHVAYIQIDGLDDATLQTLGITRLRKNPLYCPTRDDDNEWLRELANEAGMLHGVDAFNEVMGCERDKELGES